ncbi:hypothetical protein P3G55_20685 [Leptospira sp. 96542]|nr:hypothetical protein [Leptospira sp. 96542]
MMFDPMTMLAGLLPLGVEAGRLALQWLAPDRVKPTSFDQLLRLKEIELSQWTAMQGGDAPTYPWVAAVRQLQRPLFIGAVLCVWLYQAATGEPTETVTNMASAAGFYLFGDRTLFYMKGRGK